MKSNNALVAVALVSLILAVTASVTLWDDVGMAVKIGMFAFGFASGVSVGTIIARRSR